MEVYLQDAYEVLFVHSEEVAVVFSQDDGGSTGGIVHQSQLAKVLPLMERCHQPLQSVTQCSHHCHCSSVNVNTTIGLSLAVYEDSYAVTALL